MPSRPRYGERSTRKAKKVRLGSHRNNPEMVARLLRSRSGFKLAVADENDAGKLVLDEHATEKLRKAKHGDSWRERDIPEEHRSALRRAGNSQSNSFDELGDERFHESFFPRFVEAKKREHDRGVMREHFRTKYAHHALIHTLFKNPVRFRLPSGTMVRILSTGISNIYAADPSVLPRALVCVFINGQRLFFYRSSGQNSKHPNVWFPCASIEMIRAYKSDPMRVGHITKLVGHPQGGDPHFPEWVRDVSAAITRAVARGKINLTKNATPQEVEQFQEVLNFYPRMEKQGRRSDELVLPERLEN